MNLTFLLKKTTPLFLLLFCFVISFPHVEADRSIRVRKTRTHIAPKHISLSARSGGGVYARRYSYGRPIPNYSTKGNVGRNRRNFRRKRNGSRTYASGYKNWTPNRYPGRNNPRVDNVKIGNPKRRNPLVKEQFFGANKQKRRIRPNRFNPLQRPFPPKKVVEFEEEYFFPEESFRGEGKYEFENRFPRPKKKRRNPSDVEKVPKKPERIPTIPYYDEKPYKTKHREPPVSYSTFIQHPSEQDDDEYYGDADTEIYTQPIVRNKKKRVKKKSSSKKKNKDDEYYRPFTFEKEEKPEIYSSGYFNNEYEHPVKSTKKANKHKPSYDTGNDDEFVPHNSVLYSKLKPQNTNLFSSSDSRYNDYRSKDQESTQFRPSYSQPWASVVETTARPVQYQTENGFQPQYVSNQNSYQNDYSSLQKTKTVTTNTQQATYYSQPDNTYKSIAFNNNYASNQISTTNSQPSSNYNYNPYSNSVYSSQPSPTYSQPVPSSTYNNDITVQKSVPIYDNTETFYNYNNNAYANSQGSFLGSDSNKYSNRLSTYNPYTSEKPDTDEFIKKHQNLYNNGLAGVPVQGDGFGKSNVKKDYDIGYGDFQFDENPSS